MTEIVFGRHAVKILIEAGRRRVRRLHVQKGSEKEVAALLRLAEARRIPVCVEDPGTFSRPLKDRSHHQGVFAETDSSPYVDADDLLNESFLLVLDEIQDPQNLGAMCRSALLFGVGGVILSETQAAGIGPGARQASVGAVELLKIARVSSIASFLQKLKDHGFWTYGADMTAEKNVSEESFPAKVALVIGSEEKGLRRLVRERCDILLRIPTRKTAVDSLNASVAAGILLYEITKTRTAG